jgi:hypothetical protein
MEEESEIGISKREREIMSRLLRMPLEHQKSASKPTSTKGEAQRLRSERELIEANGGG